MAPHGVRVQAARLRTRGAKTANASCRTTTPCGQMQFTLQAIEAATINAHDDHRGRMKLPPRTGNKAAGFLYLKNTG